MTHEILLVDEAVLLERPGRVVCDLASSLPGPIALGLVLLNEELVDELVLRPAVGPWVVRLLLSPSPRDVQLRRYAKDRLEVILGRIEAERWLVFLLKYYRDGYAEVDHLDVEAVWATGETCDFTLKVSVFAPPLSEEEARTRLGLQRR